MPYIIKNGKTYTGNSVTLTQAQYDALSEAEKNNGVAYYIYDSDTVLDASDVGLGTGSVETLAGSVATIETSPATAIHAVGDFILWNGQLYTVISRIEVGQALTVGSNITATSAGSELTSLKSGLTNLKIANDLGRMSSSANFETALKAFADSIDDFGVIPIYVVITTASGVFLATNYIGHLYKLSNSRYRVILYAGAATDIVSGLYNSGTYVWKKITLGS